MLHLIPGSTNSIKHIQYHYLASCLHQYNTIQQTTPSESNIKLIGVDHQLLLKTESCFEQSVFSCTCLQLWEAKVYLSVSYRRNWWLREGTGNVKALDTEFSIFNKKNWSLIFFWKTELPKELVPLRQVVKLRRDLSANDTSRHPKLLKIGPNHQCQ